MSIESISVSAFIRFMMRSKMNAQPHMDDSGASVLGYNVNFAWQMAACPFSRSFVFETCSEIDVQEANESNYAQL